VVHGNIEGADSGDATLSGARDRSVRMAPLLRIVPVIARIDPIPIASERVETRFNTG
jgi:hypothetical protein